MWLLLKDPSYPLPLVQCLRSCWEQQYTKRPTAGKIEEIFQKPNCLKLRNSYEIKDTIVSAAVVRSHGNNGTVEENIWVAVYNKDGSYSLIQCSFADHAAVSSLSFKLTGQKKSPVHPKLYETVSHVYVNACYVTLNEEPFGANACMLSLSIENECLYSFTSHGLSFKLFVVDKLVNAAGIM